MFIYNVIFYNHFDNQFYEYRHRLYKNLDDAKKYVKTYLEESSKFFRDDNFHYCENDYENNYDYDHRMYILTMDHDGYYDNIIKKKVEIYKEQVY